MSTPPAPAPTAPSWPHCGRDADPVADPVGCPGIHVPGHTACLAHLSSADRDAYLAGLSPGADVDHRGTPFTYELIQQLGSALDNGSGHIIHGPYAHFGEAHFDGATFSGGLWLSGATFSGAAWFGGATFSGDVWLSGSTFDVGAQFDGATFSGDAHFGGATFSDDASFRGATFSGNALFGTATFSYDASFLGATFSSEAHFGRTTFDVGAQFGGAAFSGDAQFGGATFSDDARFDEAQFSGDARFGEVQFSGDARFDKAQFSGEAWFDKAQFSGEAWFDKAQFSGNAWFGVAQFSGTARFGAAQFSGDADFGVAQFSGTARFGAAQFSGNARFGAAQFSGDAQFNQARFAVLSWFGPVVCAGAVDLSDAVFEAPVTLEIAAGEVRCGRTRWESTAAVRLRYATADLSHAVLSFPVAVTAHPGTFTTPATRAVDESLLAGCLDKVRLVSVRGVDAAHLVLADIDLSNCLFSGAFHLDQIRLAGKCTFAPTPTGLHRRHSIWPYWWTRRRTLAEEHHWRALTAGQPATAWYEERSPRDWRTGQHHPNRRLTPDPEEVAALYRQLRKAYEDGKNEPGAADFYYGECEMRRHDRTGTPPGERGLLWGYWLLSGYGLRASRALGWLLAAVAATILLMMGLGLPNSSPRQVATGTIPAGGGRVTLTVDKQDPQLTLPIGDRFTEERFDKALQVVLNSVVFRSSGQDLTTWGTYTEMVSRFTEPVLLALAILAMRSRIKR
jgi:hypothetical protein